MALNRTGGLLATASEKGTLVRLWRVDKEKPVSIGLYRRGADKADICDIQFSYQSNFLSVSSDHNTIHIFKVDLKAEGESATDTNLEEEEGKDTNQKSGFLAGLFNRGAMGERALHKLTLQT